MQSHLIFWARVNSSPWQQENVIELDRVLWTTGSFQVGFVAIFAWQSDGMSLKYDWVTVSRLIHLSVANLDRSYPGRPVLKYISREVSPVADAPTLQDSFIASNVAE